MEDNHKKNIAEKVAQKNGNGIKQRVNLDRIRLSQDFLDEMEVSPILATIAIRRPARDEFIRVHPTREFTAGTLELKTDREVYVVDVDLIPLVQELVMTKIFLHCVTTAGVNFLWPIKTLGSDGKLDSWSRSAIIVAKVAKEKWIRVRADHAASGYVPFEAKGELDEPEYPEESWEEILDIAFRDVYIDSSEHHVIRKLRGLQV